MPSFTLETPHGLISITDTALKNDAPALLLVHGNSSSSKIFQHMLASEPLTSRYRMITFCLPGHGSSSKAPDPAKSYHMRGYAELAISILQHLTVEEVVIFGWSLGGHVGIEMLDLIHSPAVIANAKKICVKGLMITGTPPALGEEQVRKAFKMGGDLGVAGRRDWSEEDAKGMARGSASANNPELCEDWMLEDARSTDGRARMIMAQHFLDKDAGGVDQVRVVEGCDLLIAVVNGAEEQFVNLEYLEGIKWKNLWRGECIRLEGLHHAPFWEDPDGFAGLLGEFMGDAEKA
ncbi:Alpha/Beta hydrolase protein [Ampelomyces quisqualis]|uniref:Alpha/Beta hydrolase protein n=1 Tax=Ampelomyces quisqualis TaxID=50730 RepID=A0A6A5Q6D2_AMPQU|nr:Alpha/Beta hydrolase protein [Ampelomyces quisqualis]